VLAEEHPVADGAVQAVVGETVWRGVAEGQTRVPTQDVELVRLSSRVVQDETRACQGEGGCLGTGNVDRVLVAAFELDPDSVARVVADADAAPELALEQEGAVIPRKRAKPADLDLLGALCETPASSDILPQPLKGAATKRLRR